MKDFKEFKVLLKNFPKSLWIFFISILRESLFLCKFLLYYFSFLFQITSIYLLFLIFFSEFFFKPTSPHLKKLSVFCLRCHKIPFLFIEDFFSRNRTQKKKIKKKLFKTSFLFLHFHFNKLKMSGSKKCPGCQKTGFQYFLFFIYFKKLFKLKK